MQRSMSYRKPVPVYVPSPPPPPPADLQVPPLPANWREVLGQVGMLPPTSQVLPIDAGELIEMDMTSVMSKSPKGSTLTVHGDETARSTTNIPCPQKHRLYQQYRPPTPPIQSQHKARPSLLNPDNLVSDDANSEVTLAHDVHHRIDHFGLYHDYQRGRPGTSSLKISSSFRTDKTMGSFNTLNPSVGWSQGMTTRRLFNCPSLHGLRRIAGDTSKSLGPACRETLGVWAKKLWNFVIICK